MKNSFLFMVFILLISTNLIKAQATANFTASAIIIEPIGITTTSNLNFASLDARSGGTVILTPENIRTSSGGLELDEATNLSAATFEIRGEKDFAFSINLPENGFELTNGSEKMLIKDFTSSLSDQSHLSGGKKILRIGGTLIVKHNQAPGKYYSLGEMAVTVNYN